jgi:ABC-type multidrug transport system ATPase subunit
MGEALRIAALVKRYHRRQAVAGADLAVAAGEAFGLVGANGA